MGGHLKAVTLLLAAFAGASPVAAQPVASLDAPEIRAVWVDAFHSGIRSPAEADELIRAAQRANLNTLFVQVRRRGDALYTIGVEPPLDDAAYDPAFDALAYIVQAGHAAGLQVHAWVNAMPVWRDEAPPKDARHVFNQHGPNAPDAENWLTAAPSGDRKFPVGYFLDPGHPGAAAYLADIYLNIVRNYRVDGIHFDYVRYPETDERLTRGADVGYNAVNLARFRRATGRTDTPAPADEQWMAWRRTQVTNLVRRVSVEAKAINPRIIISAALIPWGAPPTNEKDFADVAPMQRIYQDWHQWLQDGLLDLGVPMNYARETDERVRGWFNGWIAWEKQHQHGRQLAVGIGAYLNDERNTLAQVDRVRQPQAGKTVVGLSFFSYAVPQLVAAVPVGAAPPLPLAGPERLKFLAEGVGGRPGVFLRAAPVPAMPWIDRPDTGWIAGVVKNADGTAADGVTVKIRRSGFPLFKKTQSVQTDGNGYYGLAKVKSGRYDVWSGEPRPQRTKVNVEIAKRSRADFALTTGGGAAKQ